MGFLIMSDTANLGGSQYGAPPVVRLKHVANHGEKVDIQSPRNKNILGEQMPMFVQFVNIN